MAKKILKIIKLQIKGAQANPSPPIGPALGSAGVNIIDFCKQFNARTKEKQGELIPVIITVYEDKTFQFILKSVPVSIQLITISKIKKGSGEPNRIKVSSVSWDEINKIAKNKMGDLNCFDLNSAISMVAGTARSMGINIIGKSPLKENSN